MSERFIIDCYGIIDTFKSHTGKCEEDKLTWEELCNTLNELDDLCNDKFDEYEHIVRLKRENQELKKRLEMTSGAIHKAKEWLKSADEMIDHEIQ